MKLYTLITGASQGFGKALAIEYAKNSMNLILVSLPNSGLMELSSFLEKNFDISILPFEMDLSSAENCMHLFNTVKEKEVSVQYLINNAGMSSKGLFEEMDKAYFLKQISVNVMAPTILIKLFLDDFKQNSPSGILNVSSMAGFFHLPRKQVYGATKSYLLSFSRSLRKELKPYNISVCTVCPGGMNTTTDQCLEHRTMNRVSRRSIMNPEDVAKLTIAQFQMGKEVIIPGKMNKLVILLNSILPNAIKNMLTRNAI